MAKRAEFVECPSGTEYRTSSKGEWQTATVGLDLLDGYQSRNTEGNNYTVNIVGDGGVRYGDSDVSIALSKISGTVKILKNGKDWTTISTEGTYHTNEIGVGPGGGVQVVCGMTGTFKPRGWNSR